MGYRKWIGIAGAVCLVLLGGSIAWADDASQCEKLYQSKQYKQAFPVCRKAAEQGDAKAQFNLGVMYHQGWGVKQDYAEATRWYRKAAVQGHAKAQSSLGIMYANGWGVKQDYAEAMSWFWNAAEQGEVTAQFNLGSMYTKGQGVQQSLAKAVKWFHKAAERGLAKAQLILGMMYGAGQGVKQDYAEAVKWYRKAAEQGYTKAQFNLGVMYTNGQGVKQSYAKAVKWFRKAAERRLAAAQYALGVMYANGRGKQRDYAEAVKWYRKAAEQGFAKAQHDLAVMYANGEGVKQNYVEAVKWYRNAAEQGLAAAQFHLAVRYDNGQGVKKDRAKAAKWYRKAAEQGNAEAQHALDVMYANSFGVKKDDAEATKWYRMTAMQRQGKTQQNPSLASDKIQNVRLDNAKAFDKKVKKRWGSKKGDKKTDTRIAIMQNREVNPAVTGKSSLESILTIVRQKKTQAEKLEVLRQQQRRAFEVDLAKYREIVNSKYGKGMEQAAWNSLIARHPEAFKRWKLGIPDMVSIPGGTFRMGDIQGGGESNEKPVHTVHISPFRIMRTEVTQSLWERVMGNDWTKYRGDAHPEKDVSWNDVQTFIHKLNMRTGLHFRLPSEAEWEYAARAGSSTKYFWGNDVGSNRANCKGCGSRWDDKETAPVGSFQPNAFGLYDMHGNVAEWVQDCWHDSYKEAPTNGSAWISGNCSLRVIRGGSLERMEKAIRSASRDWGGIGRSNKIRPQTGHMNEVEISSLVPVNVGFRLVQDESQPVVPR